jgi:hypothetical protein
MAEEHARWKQYEYAANSNLVLTSERRSRDNEPSVSQTHIPAAAPSPASSCHVLLHCLRTCSCGKGRRICFDAAMRRSRARLSMSIARVEGAVKSKSCQNMELLSPRALP